MGTRYVSTLNGDFAGEVAALGEGERPTMARAMVADRIADAARPLLVSGSLDEPTARPAFDRLNAVDLQAPVFDRGAPLDGMVGRTIADGTLTQAYELVVLRRTRSGRLRLGGHQLFPHSARRGDYTTFTIRCERSDGNGTVFAVVAVEGVRDFQLVSIESGDIFPGAYELTAELLHPGIVRFHGLPVQLRADHRSWAELVGAIPAKVDLPEPAHLVCAVEVSGTADQVQERISRVEQLVGLVTENTERELAVSLLSYGPHSFEWNVIEEPAKVLTWASSADTAMSALKTLRDRGPVETDYIRAAQIECMLAKVASRLGVEHGRPVLVTVGSRRPYPQRMDPRTEILPCPRRNDWRRALQRIRALPGSAFGAICESNGTPGDRGDEDVWPRLGSDAIVDINAVNIRRFAADLGLFSLTVKPIPFPIVEKVGN
jgi:hypothetical protein